MQLRKCWARGLDYGTQIFKLNIAGQASALKSFEGKLRQGAGFWFGFCLICTVWGRSRHLTPPPPRLAWSWHWTWDSPHSALLGCYPTQPAADWGVGRGGLLCYRRRALQAGGLVKSGGGKFHLRSGFLQTRCGALGIEAMFLSNAGKWSWGWRGGAEQAPRSNLGKEKKESEANRNSTVPVCRCNLTWLSPLSAKGGTWC